MAVLPPAATEEAFVAIRQDEAALRPGIERLCQRLGVDASRPTRYVAGSRPVYAAGDLVLKLSRRWQRGREYRVEGAVHASDGAGAAIKEPYATYRV